jgi:hypothetical protein
VDIAFNIAGIIIFVLGLRDGLALGRFGICGWIGLGGFAFAGVGGV